MQKTNTMNSRIKISPLQTIGLSFLMKVAVLFSACSSSDPETPEYWMEKALQHYHAELMHQPYAAPAAYFEKAKCGDRYCKYSEGYGHFVYLGDDVEIPMVNRTFLADRIKRSNPSSDWLSYIDNSREPEMESRSDFQPGYTSVLGAVRRMELSGLFNERASQNYNYQIRDTLKIEDDPSNRKFKISFSSEDELYQGVVFIHEETSRFKRVVLDKAPVYAEPLYEWQSAEGEIRFDTDESGNYHLKLIRFEYTKDSLTHIVVLKSEAPIHRFDEVTDDTYAALYENSTNPIVYYQQQEQDHPLSFNHRNMVSIQEDLGNDKPLSQQFRANAGSPYLRVNLSSGDAMQPLAERDNYYLVEEIRAKLEIE